MAYHKFIFIILALFSFFFTGCSSKTTVVLLDSGKSQNAIIVSTLKGSSRLDTVGSFVELKGKESVPSQTKTMSKKEIKSRFSNVLEASPKKAISYMLYFKSGSIELTKESNSILEKALKSIKERSPCMVDIIGHTDTVGSNEDNLKVSLKRAKHIQSIVKKRGIEVVELTIRGYGEEDLLIKTADNIEEAQNRSVEIFIK